MNAHERLPLWLIPLRWSSGILVSVVDVELLGAAGGVASCGLSERSIVEGRIFLGCRRTSFMMGMSGAEEGMRPAGGEGRAEESLNRSGLMRTIRKKRRGMPSAA
jgi:hypothetical protein